MKEFQHSSVKNNKMNSHVTVTQILKYQDFYIFTSSLGFPGGSAGKESALNAGDLCSIPGLGRSLERGPLPTPVFWPGEFHGLYGPWGSQRVGHDWVTFTSINSTWIILIFHFHTEKYSNFCSVITEQYLIWKPGKWMHTSAYYCEKTEHLFSQITFP